MDSVLSLEIRHVLLKEEVEWRKWYIVNGLLLSPEIPETNLLKLGMDRRRYKGSRVT